MGRSIMMANIIEYLYSLMQILELFIVIFVPAIAISIPIWYFLIYSLEERKLEIANEFSDDAIDQYYRFIYQNNRNTDKGRLRKTFENHIIKDLENKNTQFPICF